MARMLRSIDEEVYVEYGMFALAGTDLEEWSSPEGYHFVADVRMEAWDGEPPSPEGSWTPVDQVTFVADSGVVHLSLMMEERGHDFLIGPPCFEYGMTLHFEPLTEDGEPDEEMDEDADGPEERWLLRFWPIRDAFDPLVHSLAASYIVPMPKEYVPLPLPPELLPPPVRPQSVPVPLTVAQDWVSMWVDPSRPTFEEWLSTMEEGLRGKGMTIHEWLRAQGVEIEDGAEVTPKSVVRPEDRPGRFADPLVDRYYARQEAIGFLPHRFPDWEPHEQEERLREMSDEERIAEELNPENSRTFSMPYEGRGFLSPGLSCRLWRWEDDIIGGEPFDGSLTVDRQVHVRYPHSRQIFVSGIVTVLRPERYNGRADHYVVRDAEPHEAARVLCSEATWQDRPEGEPGR
ncbi:MULTISPECIES: hypothetical protein [unclassified Streptosporangium]|uniref:hypothetical protein n=1 Tax=unclassified Streptosporangium TaxID=2632669 RepID=UPI002E29B54F|nr:MULTISPECIES: hypothetical protein [unclassified Streptosporangium]